jgi:hypothetical protein
MPKTRCPNGSRKNKSGTCVSTNQKQKPGSIKKCSKGTRKNKNGVCVIYTSTKKNRSENKSSVRKTPRSIYARRYFADNKTRIHLLDKINVGDNSVMFQVNYNDVSQFTNYENLHDKPQIDCFFQSIFSLGLRDVKIAKIDSKNINAYGKSGVTSDDIRTFIKNAFNLSLYEVVEFTYVRLDKYVIEQKKGRKFIKRLIGKFLDGKIKEGYASLIFVERFYEDGRRGGHYIITYKNNNIVYYFDPQKKSRANGEHDMFNSTDIYKVLNSGIISIGYFTINNLKSPMPLLDTTCPIRYLG